MKNNLRNLVALSGATAILALLLITPSYPNRDGASPTTSASQSVDGTSVQQLPGAVPGESPIPGVQIPELKLFSGLWTNKLAANTPVEDRPAFNGTDDFTNNRNGTSYAQRFANQARYHSASTPVAGYYAKGDNTVISTDAGPLFIIPTANHPRQRVWMLNDDGSEMWPGTNGNLPQKFHEVPVPQGPNGERFEEYYGRELQSAGGDRQLAIYDPSTDEMWEFFQFRWDAANNRYAHRWGAYIPNATGEGSVETLANNWGARATGFPLMGGVITRTDWERGEINHPLGVAIPVVKPGYIPPANREDANITWHTKNNDGRDAVPEGAIFRLPADFVVNENKYPENPEKSKLHAMMLKAARDYGIVVYDGTGGSVTFAIEDSTAIGTPYSKLTTSTLPSQNWTSEYSKGLFFGSKNHLLDFPWDTLQQVKFGAVAEVAPPAPPAPTVLPNLLWNPNYKDTNSPSTVIPVWKGEQEPAPDRITRVIGTEVPGNSTNKPTSAMRVELRAGDVTSDQGHRAEVLGRYPRYFTEPPANYPDPVGSERWYAYSVYVPEDYQFQTDTTWMVFTQWKGLQHISPPIAMEIKRDGFRFGGVRTNQGLVPNDGNLGKVERGKWTRFVIGIKHSPDPKTGWVEVWRDGTQRISRVNIATMDYYAGTTNVDPTYLKQGIYRDKRTLTNNTLYLSPVVISDNKAAVS